MSRNILLLYMSRFTAKYDGGKLLRQQTNEGAVTELYADKYARPDKIIALCSDAVRSQKCGVGELTTLEYFRDDFLGKQLKMPADRLKVIEVADSMGEHGQVQAIAEILPEIEQGDDLYIDFSGGMRDVAMLLVIIARYLQDIRGVQTRQVLYGELNGNTTRVNDVTRLYELFDLISAVDAFFATGSVNSLQSYLRVKRSKEINRLLQAIECFSDDLSLCRVGELKSDLKEIGRALKDRPAEKRDDLDLLLYTLMEERFTAEFSPLLGTKDESLPALAAWCEAHRLYQQALTLLCEQMPEYICSHLLLQPTDKGFAYMQKQAQNIGKAWPYPLFHYHFCRCATFHEYPYAKKQGAAEIDAFLDVRGTEDVDDVRLFRVARPEELAHYLSRVQRDGELLLDPQQKELVQECILLYQQLMQYRNQINHANAASGNVQYEGVGQLDRKSVGETLQQANALLRKLQPLKVSAPDGTVLRSAEEKIKAAQQM